MSEALVVPEAVEVDDLTTSGLLRALRAERAAEDAAAAHQLSLAARWADLHPPESIHEAAAFTSVGLGREHEEPLAGPGVPDRGGVQRRRAGRCPRHVHRRG